MNRKQVIEWLRAEAATLNAAADSLEGNESQSWFATMPPTRSFESQATNGRSSVLVTASQIRDRLKKGSTRVPQLAKEFHADEAVLRAIVNNPDSGIIMESRGWLKLRNPDEANSR